MGKYVGKASRNMSQGSSGPLQAYATGASSSILMLPQPQLLTAVFRWRGWDAFGDLDDFAGEEEGSSNEEAVI